MDQFTQDLKKVLKAGIGAVAAGLEKSQEAIDTLAKKGEPLYEQAKSVVTDAAGKVKQAVSDGIEAISAKPQVQEVIDTLRGMGEDAWKQVREALDEFEIQAAEAKKAAEEAKNAAQEILNTEAPEAEEAEESAEETACEAPECPWAPAEEAEETVEKKEEPQEE